MSSFDEALRRQEAEQRAAYAGRVSYEDQRRRIAEAAVMNVTRLLREFAQRLGERGVRPTRVELPRGQGMFRLPRHSPEGYELMGRRPTYTTWSTKPRKNPHQPTFLSLVTPDGRFWSYGGASGEGFVPITVETILGDTSRTTLWLDGDSYISFGEHGEALVLRNGDPPEITPLEEFLASCAVRLIQGNPS